jgi:hypothetical protein
MGLIEWLFLVLLVLKLTHYINWSWWLITAPLWAEFIILTYYEMKKEFKKPSKKSIK